MTEKRTPYGDPKLIRLIPKPPQLDGDEVVLYGDKQKEIGKIVPFNKKTKRREGSS